MTRLRLLAIALLLAGAGLFAIGTSLERSQHHDEPAKTSERGESHNESGESAGQRRS